MLTALIASFLTPVTFPGGGPVELAASIADSTQKPAVIAELAMRGFAKFDYDTANMTDMARTIFANTALRQAPGEYAYHPDTIPASFIQVEPFSGRWSPPNFRYTNLAPEAVKDGKVTWAPRPGEALRTQNLENRFSKAVRFHWTQEPYAIMAKVTDLPEADFVRLVAKALGGKYSSRKEAYVIDFDPDEFRKRARNTLATAKPKDLERLGPLSRSNYDLCVAAIKQATRQNMLEAFLTQGGRTAIPMVAGQEQMVLARMDAVLQRQEAGDIANVEDRRGTKTGSFERKPNRNALRRMDNVDLRYGAAIILESNFRVQVEAVTVDVYGRPAGKIRF